MNIPNLNLFSKREKQGRIFKVINIIAMMTFIFNMTAFQALFLALPAQAAVTGKPHAISVDIPEDPEEINELDPIVSPPEENLGELYPDLAIEKKIVEENEEGLIYLLQIVNQGNAPALAVEVIDELPEGFVIKEIDPAPYSQEGQTLTWRDDKVEVDETIQLTIVGNFDETKLKECTERVNNAQSYDRQYRPEGWDAIPAVPAEPEKTKKDNESAVATANNYGCGSLLVTKIEEGPALPEDFGFRIVGWKGEYYYPAPGEDSILFKQLDPGKYAVEEDTAQTNYYQTDNTCSEVLVVGGKQAECTITNSYRVPQETITISGVKYEDGNDNGMQDEGELRDDWEICATKGTPEEDIISLVNAVFFPHETEPLPMQNSTKCVLTGSGEGWSDGYYEFVFPKPPATSPNPITVNITETLKPGWVQIVPLFVPENEGKNYYEIEIGEENNYPNNDFGNQLENADISLTKTIAPSNLVAGGSISYQLDYENTGNVPLTNVQIVDDYPEQYVTVTNAGGAVDNGNTLTWLITPASTDDLGVGEIGTVSYQVSIESPLANNTPVANSAIVTGFDGDEPVEATAQATANIQSASTLTIQKNDNADPITLGNQIVYTINWTSSGNAPLNNLTITDPLPANTTFVSASNGGTYDAVTNKVTWNLGNPNPGATGSVTLTVATSATTAIISSITNTATISATEVAPVSDTENTQVAVAPVLSLSKTDNVDTTSSAGTLSYVISWSLASAQATNVTIVDPVPTNLTFISASAGGTYDAVSKTITWNLGNKLPGNSGTVSFMATVNAGLTNGTVITNNATIDSTETSPLSATDTTAIEAVSAPILQLTKNVDTALANPGDTVTYTVVVTNFGSAEATNLVLTDVLPTGLSFVSGEGTTKTFTLGDLAIGNSVTQTYDVSIASTAGSGTYDNLATVEADNHDPLSAIASLDVRIPTVLGEDTTPNLTITKTVNVSFANPGDTVEYTVHVTNVGDGDAINVVLTDQLPGTFTFANSTDTVKAWELGNLSPDETKTVSYSVVIGNNTTAGIHENLAIANAENEDEIEARAALEVRAPSVLGALEETGTSFADYLFYLTGLGALALGVSLYLYRKQELKVEKTK